MYSNIKNNKFLRWNNKEKTLQLKFNFKTFFKVLDTVNSWTVSSRDFYYETEARDFDIDQIRIKAKQDYQ